MAKVTLKNIVKRYGQLEILKDICIEIADGEFVALVGPSGCGKSTLLRTIAGLESIQSGDVKIGEQIVNNIEPKHRDIAMVFQSYALYPQMTVAENMGFALKLKKVDKRIIQSKVEQVAQMLDLSAILARYPRQLSGGQRQRVAMGRAIVRDPQVFLFDEPLSNLDAKLRGRMRLELKQLHQTLKTTTLYVTHDQIEAMTLADKVVVLRDGKVEQIGTPLHIYDTPANVFVAGFIGSPSMNFLKGKISSQHPHDFITIQGSQISLGNFNKNIKILLDRDLILGIRPEDIALVTLPQQHGITVTIQVTEQMGAETHVLTFLPLPHQSQTKHNVEELFIISKNRDIGQTGEQLHLSINAEKLHFFDALTEQRINTQQ
ncbi:ABC transporter ATP-binding protein [Acinetobacter populi]|uniref:Sugar ABC transporter ATP-binding protein n=1 Tax=Acinetobacter populi TaxID=1582270 RepID=A0A1Z9Z2K1_9GAMM|nr:sn-glycerol-3-phosphate ABC transporter ATP-binding protein UgpC [Acinetobacter populi]OUY08690.1 sugar ABC transporter ATP-binding protein [Acinetobacter populi]